MTYLALKVQWLHPVCESTQVNRRRWSRIKRRYSKFMVLKFSMNKLGFQQALTLLFRNPWQGLGVEARGNVKKPLQPSEGSERQVLIMLPYCCRSHDYSERPWEPSVFISFRRWTIVAYLKHENHKTIRFERHPKSNWMGQSVQWRVWKYTLTPTAKTRLHV